MKRKIIILLMSVVSSFLMILCAAPINEVSDHGSLFYDLSGAGMTVSAATLKTVKGLKVSSVKSTSLKLTWSKVSGAKYYQIRQSKDGKEWKTVKTTEKTSCTVKSLKSNTNYQFKIKALNSTKKKTVGESSVIKIKTAKSSASILKSYYKKNFAAKNSGMCIRDFNHDKKKEMLVAKFKLGDKTPSTASYTLHLYLYSVKNGKVILSAERKIKGGSFSENAVYTKIYVSAKGYAYVESFAGMYCSGHYIVYDLRSNKIQEKVNLLDPGYSSGIGIYYDDKYPEGALYEYDYGFPASGKYSSYLTALKKEIGKYGIKFKKHKFNSGYSNREKYIASPSENCVKLYSYNSYK